MISERELRQIAAKTGLGVGQSEHEYVLLCVLDALRHTPPLADTFCLKGGTALRLVHFDDWRHSVDLDFSVLPAFPGDQLQSLIEIWFNKATTLHDIEMRLSDFHRVNGAARMRARFIGPLRHPARLLFDITLDEPVLLPPQSLPVTISPFPNLRPVVLTYTLEEILAEKIRSILQRGKARDYYDVWRLLGEKRRAFDSKLIHSILADKCRHKDLPVPTTADLLRPEQLVEAEIYWERDLAGQISAPNLPTWQTVIVELRELLDEFLDIS